MIETGAVEKAAQLLEGHLTDARRARDELDADIKRIEAALTTLRGGNTTAEPASQLVTGAVDGGLFSEPTKGMSVRSAVKHILDNTPRALTSKEIRAMIPPQIMEAKASEKNRVNSISTALWGLRQAGAAVQVEGKKHIASKWLETAEGNSPVDADESPSDNHQRDQEGGKGRYVQRNQDRDDHHRDEYPQGDHLPV